MNPKIFLGMFSVFFSTQVFADPPIFGKFSHIEGEHLSWYASSQFQHREEDLILDDVSKELAQSKTKTSSSFVVFDIDETVFDTRYGMKWAIEKRWSLHPDSKRFPTVYEALSGKSVQMLSNTAEETFVKNGLQANGPAFEAFQSFWLKLFFSEDYTSHNFDIYPGLRELIKSYQAQGAKIVFLTGRNEPQQGKGTREALRRAGVLDDSMEVLMKTEFETTPVFKAKALKQLSKRGKVLAVFDNDPVNLVEMRKEVKNAKYVLFVSRFERIPEAPSSDLYRVSDWRPVQGKKLRVLRQSSSCLNKNLSFLSMH